MLPEWTDWATLGGVILSFVGRALADGIVVVDVAAQFVFFNAAGVETLFAGLAPQNHTALVFPDCFEVVLAGCRQGRRRFRAPTGS